MRHLPAALLLLIAPAATAQSGFSLTPPLPWPPVATFSILGYDPATGEVGGAVQSRVFSVGNGVLWAEAGVGAVATQAIVDVSYGPQALALLRGGLSPRDVIRKVWSDDPDPRPQDWTKEGRQFAVINAQGEVAAYTGPKATPWAGDKQGKHCTAQGNILASEAVVSTMVAAFESTGGHLSFRLLAALEAGQRAGGDTRGMQSAAMLIVKKDAGVWLHNDVVLRLQVDDSPQPIAELRRLVEKNATNRRLARPDPPAPDTTVGDHVVLVISDGLRWQEVFRGAEQPLMGKAGKVRDSTALHHDFWRETPEARRATLMPFLWGTIAREGQLFGDSASGSVARITNRYKFSYPGYSETFTGFFDPRIDSNNFPPNPNTTVLEWLNRDPAFAGRVEAYATWSAFRRIINTERSGIPVYDGWDRGVPAGLSGEADPLRTLYRTTTRMWADNAVDALMHEAMRTGTRRALPRVLFIGYGETDEWAHDGRYDLYLRSAQQVDRFLESLWTAWQSDPKTRGKVTLLISTDHGRGWGREWTDHGEEVNGAEFIWSAAIGPRVAPLGVRRNTPTTQAQMAATIAAALGRTWQKAEPRAAPPLPIFK